MAEFILFQQMLPATELITAMTGSDVAIGTLLFTPVKLIFDNQSTSSVVIKVDVGGLGNKVSWKTFSAGEALVLDDDLYTFPKNTIFYGNGAAAGNFSIAYTYINYPT